MAKKSIIILLLNIFISLPSCNIDEEYSSDARTNFEALWGIIDKHYCFFEYKEIDWNAIYEKYRVQLTDSMDKYQLFNLMGKMLAELKDGHTNLISPFNVSRFWDWSTNYPDNFNVIVHKKYLGNNYNIAGGMRYLILRDSIGYVYYGDFSNSIGESNLNEMFLHFKDCKAIIFDVRNNGGGTLTNSERIASRFIDETRIVGYIMHKTGPGHNDLSSPHAIELKPTKYIKWLRPVAVLTNRSCYSATNDFVNKMKLFPQVTIIGDKTGGGCGLPFHSELPNGWSVRFSSSPILDANKEYTEYGVAPDIKIDIEDNDQLNNIDTIIEEAINYLKKKTEGMKPEATSTEYGNCSIQNY
jgi:C-terminal processing protease CtpA/Prc